MRNKQYDLLRLLAAILVIVSHSYDLLDLRDLEPLNRVTHGRFIFSDLGIYIFFILSGYLISQSFSNTNSVYAFAVRRFLRIFPGLIVVVLLTTFLAGPLLSAVSFQTYFTHQDTYLYLLNITLLQMHYELPGVFKHNAATYVNGSLWTLQYEAIMYVIVAFQFFIPVGTGRKWFAGFAFIFCFSLYLLGFSYKIPVVRISLDKMAVLGTLFAIGMMIYSFQLVRLLQKIHWIFVLALNLALLFYLPVPLFIFVALPLLIFKFSALKTSFINKATFYGDVSYGMYIYAFMIQQFFVSRYAVSPLGLFLFGLGGAWIAGLISWKIIEQPALLMKQKFVFGQKENR